MKKVVSLFGGGDVRKGTPAWREAYRTGKLLAEAGYIVMNGGYGGSMTASAEGAKSAGGKTIGITTRDFGPPKANQWIDREKRLPHWQDRLIYLVKNSDACVALAGQLGTLIEIAVTLEMIRKKLISAKPIVLVGARWRKVFMPYLTSESKEVRSYFHFVSSLKEVPKFLP